MLLSPVPSICGPPVIPEAPVPFKPERELKQNFTLLLRSRYRVECFPRFGRFSSVPEAAAGITDVEHVLAATRI